MGSVCKAAVCLIIIHAVGGVTLMPEWVCRILKLFSFQGAFVLDPFAGVGTTPLAAKKHGRHYLGIDISPDYCHTAQKRLEGVRVFT